MDASSPSGHFEFLPLEVQEVILLNLPSRDLATMERCSSYFRKVVVGGNLWRRRADDIGHQAIDKMKQEIKKMLDTRGESVDCMNPNPWHNVYDRLLKEQKEKAKRLDVDESGDDSENIIDHEESKESSVRDEDDDPFKESSVGDEDLSNDEDVKFKEFYIGDVDEKDVIKSNECSGDVDDESKEDEDVNSKVSSNCENEESDESSDGDEDDFKQVNTELNESSEDDEDESKENYLNTDLPSGGDEEESKYIEAEEDDIFRFYTHTRVSTRYDPYGYEIDCGMVICQICLGISQEINMNKEFTCPKCLVKTVLDDWKASVQIDIDKEMVRKVKLERILTKDSEGKLKMKNLLLFMMKEPPFPSPYWDMANEEGMEGYRNDRQIRSSSYKMVCYKSEEEEEDDDAEGCVLM